VCDSEGVSDMESLMTEGDRGGVAPTLLRQFATPAMTIKFACTKLGGRRRRGTEFTWLLVFKYCH
jgi:hypothetical protein